jgi:hypothetical protein
MFSAADVEQVRCKLAAQGYAPLPLIGKRPVVKEWATRTSVTSDEIRLWRTVYADAKNTGCLTARTPVIDVDIIDSAAADAIEELAREHFEERGWFLVRFGNPPKRAIPLRTDQPFKKMKLTLVAPGGSEAKIEILADGQQFVVNGIHPDTHASYRWHGGELWDIPADELPYVSEEWAQRFLRAAEQLLVQQFACRPAVVTADANGTQTTFDQIYGADWQALIARIRAGVELHDTLCSLSMSAIASGMHEAAATRMLQALMMDTSVARDARWQARYDDIPRIVHSAARKQGKSSGPHVEAQYSKPQVRWPSLDEAAYYGLAGDVVRTVSPESEADPVAILIQFLASAGNIVGRRCYYPVESDRHHANLYAVLVGQSSKARKGTSWGRVSAVAKIADQQWAEDRRKGGLSSGEGLINEVRNEVVKWDGKEKTWEVVDPGVTDKRLMIVEAEFAGALAVMERHGNTLSPLLRKAWDGDKLSTMTRNNPLTATGAHISVIAHITEAELRARLTRTDTANGFANRFLFPLVRRSKELPFGGALTDRQVLELGESLRNNLSRIPASLCITMTDAAKALWAGTYSSLSADKPGMLGAVTARAEAQTVRMAMVYAILDGQSEIDIPHLTAALAVWRYCEDSAANIFGDATGDPVTDEITAALRSAGAAGLTRTAIRDLFGRNQSADRISAALADLLTRGVARCEMHGTGGRAAETWVANGGKNHG